MKTLVTILLAWLLPALAWAQGPLLWDKTLGGSGWDEPDCVVATPDGGCIIGGYSLSGKNGDKSEGGRGGADIWIVKLDAQGNKVWDKTIGGGDHEFARGVISTKDGNYLIIGSSKSNKGGDKSENSKGDFDVWIVKIDENGNKIWDKTYGGSAYDASFSGFVSQNGDIIIVGASASNKSNDKSEDCNGEADYWIIKINTDGSKVWDKTLGGSGYDACHAVANSSDDGYFLAGYSQSPKGGDKTEDRKYEYDGWVVKIDKDGNKIWDRTLGQEDNFYYRASVLATPDSGCLFTANKGFEPIKLDGNGQEQWRKNYKGNACYTLMNLSDGGFLIAGNSQSNKGQYKSEDSRGGEDFWIIKLDMQGQLIRDKTLGGNHGDDCHAIVATTDKGLILVGRSESDSSGEKTQNSHGQVDYWVVKLGPESPPLQWRNMITRPATVGRSDGVIRMAVYGGKAPYEYSIDDGANWQSERIFSKLAAQTYKAAVRDASGAVIHIDVLLRER